MYQLKVKLLFLRAANITVFYFTVKGIYLKILLLITSKTNILPGTEFQNKIKRWYKENKRSLPWRETSDPYRIWLSEIILQQTRVNQGRPYYEKFIRHYPDVHSLANADMDKVMKDWEGLGYYSRARNMHETAKFIARERDGVFPSTYEEILRLKGVGEYTASAIASFAFGKAEAVLDGNVYRVLSRYLGIEKPVNKAKKEFSEAARNMLDRKDPALYNQAIMEFGALQCVPGNPDCSSCVLNDSCSALKAGMVDKLPYKERIVYDRKRYFYYLLIRGNGKVAVHQRTAKDIWRGLFEFPLIEMPVKTDPELVMKSEANFLKGEYRISGFHILKPHKLSHQTIHCYVFDIVADDLDKGSVPDPYSVRKWEETEGLGFPRPLRVFIDSSSNQMSLNI